MAMASSIYHQVRSLDHGQVKIPVLDIGAILLPPGSVYELGTEKIAIPENQYVELPSTAVVTIPLVGYCRQTQGQIVRIMDTKELEHIEEICKNWYHREVIIPSQIPNLIDSYIKHCKKIVFGRLAERSPNPYWRLPPP
ncbi:hypothetical protein APHAL10511_008136 [Amanita phalloides]|nr:hypothetical protein APHAL10511_008136 [Amanita phalloides]